MNTDDVAGAQSVKETIFAIGSGATAIGFWGVVIVVALDYYPYEIVSIPWTNDDFLFFSVLFTVGLLAMGVSSLKRVGSRR
jgi:hypothetical protein